MEKIMVNRQGAVKVKTFFSRHGKAVIDKEVNEWLVKNNHIAIVSHSFATDPEGFSTQILYTE